MEVTRTNAATNSSLSLTENRFFLFMVIDRASTCCMAYRSPFRLPYEGELFVARSCRASEDAPLRRLSSRILG
jgi:hypothetical protein